MSKYTSVEGGIPSKEKNNHPQGRSGSATKQLGGIVGTPKKNPTSGGGINRATKG